MATIRPALQSDLRSIYEVWYQNEVLDVPQPPAPGKIPAYLQHVIQTGTMFVAEQDRKLLAFAGAIKRGKVAFLTDLFVRPTHQSGQLGKSLLQAALPQDNLIHCTSSSSDPRALALYVRAGMQPQWPHLELQSSKPLPSLPDQEIEIIEAESNDPELINWDAQIGGRLRPEDHQFWASEQRAIPLWFRRHGQFIGYGYIRRDAGTLWSPQACLLGPIGVRNPQDSIPCILAAVQRASRYASELHIQVPGPHPALKTLLEIGFQIDSIDTFVSSSSTPFFDPQCYVSSGGDLL